MGGTLEVLEAMALPDRGGAPAVWQFLLDQMRDVVAGEQDLPTVRQRA